MGRYFPDKPEEPDDPLDGVADDEYADDEYADDDVVGDDDVDPDPAPDPVLALVDVLDEEGAMGDPPAEPPVEVDLPTAIAERDQYLALARQVQADFENYRKRAQAHQAAAEARGGARIATAVLPVLDACDNAIIHGAEGIAPIYKALFEALSKNGLSVIPAEGEPFDPTRHEAVVHEPGDGGVPVVVEDLRTGYTWHEQVLRAAMVKVRD